MLELQSSDHSPEQGSFVTGVVLGVCVGATGYFLFGTPRGQDIRTRLVTEWDEAKDRLVKEGVVPHPQVTLRGFIHDLIAQATGVTLNLAKSLKDERSPRSQLHKKPGRSTAAAASSSLVNRPLRRVSPNNKFKGV